MDSLVQHDHDWETNGWFKRLYPYKYAYECKNSFGNHIQVVGETLYVNGLSAARPVEPNKPCLSAFIQRLVTKIPNGNHSTR
jgi:hypothetical protein